MSYPRSLKAETVPVLKKCSIALTRIEFDYYTMRTSTRHHNVEVHRDTDLKIMLSSAQSVKTMKNDQKKVDSSNKTALQKTNRRSKSNLSVDEYVRRMESADTLSLDSLSLADKFVAQSLTASALQQQSQNSEVVDKISHCQCSRNAMIEFNQQSNSTSCSSSARNALANSGNNTRVIPLQCAEQTVSCKPYNLYQQHVDGDFIVPKKFGISQDKICTNNHEDDVNVDEEFKTPKNPSTGLTNKTVIDSGTWTTYETSCVVSEIERGPARCDLMKQSRIEKSMLNKRVLQQHKVEKSRSKRLKSKKITNDDSALTTQDRATAMLSLAYSVSKKRRISENFDEQQDDTNLSVLVREKNSSGSKSTSTIFEKIITMGTNAYEVDDTCTTEPEPLQINKNANVQNQKTTLSQKQSAFNRMLLNILNMANIVQLQSLPNIGGKRAFTIYHYRELNGSFKSLKDLQNVPIWNQGTWKKFLAVNNVVLEE